MLYKTLYGTNLQISCASVGTMSFGATVDQKTASNVLDCALDNGVNMLDTANWYNSGESERILGRILPGHNREKIVLASKVAYCLKDGKTTTDLSPQFITSAVDESLRRMGTDYLDICYFHAPDYNTPIEESLEAMNGLFKAGKVRYFGLSNYAAWQLTDIIWRSECFGYISPVVSQNVYNLLSRSLDTELKPCLKEKNIGLVVFNPLAGGLLSGKHERGIPAAGTRFSYNKMYFERYWNDNSFCAIDMYEAVAKEAGISLLELALRWCLSQDIVSSMLLGMSKLAQFEQNIEIIQKGPLCDDVLKKCDQIWNHLHAHEVSYSR